MILTIDLMNYLLILTIFSFFLEFMRCQTFDQATFSAPENNSLYHRLDELSTGNLLSSLLNIVLFPYDTDKILVHHY
jgi:hypothetical protein